MGPTASRTFRRRPSRSVVLLAEVWPFGKKGEAKSATERGEATLPREQGFISSETT